MEQLKTLYRIINLVLPLSDFFYILQIEEYSSKRFIKWLPLYFFKRDFQKRDSLKFTKRVKISIFFTLIIWITSLLVIVSLLNEVFIQILILLLWSLLTPIFVLIGNTLVSPYFEYRKSAIRALSVEKINSNPNLKIILIAGSYGKTTTKNFIYQLVQYSYKTQMIPGNINTPAGIANWVNNSLQTSTQLLIAEVDAYEVGEIAKSCSILKADISVLTNIGDQHLERFGNVGNLAMALSEVFAFSKPNANLITTSDVLNTLTNKEFGLRELTIIKPHAVLKYNSEALDVSHLSQTNRTNLNFALCVASILNVPSRFVVDSVAKLELPDRRQKPSTIFGYQAIDDSYNISYSTALAGINFAKEESKKANKKLLVITAGIPELSNDNKDKNQLLGSFLEKNADYTVVLKSILYKDILSGFTNNEKYILVKDLKTFIKDINPNFTKDEWFLLLQPELNDLYY